MRTSALLALFFSFFFVIGMTVCLPLSLPDSDYALVITRDTLGSQNKRVMDPVTGPLEQFLRMLGNPRLREMQLQVEDYCSHFSCRKPKETFYI
ncbi:uncharacterized protein EDB91DRAFT_1122464 [Suillus paluster]|uniref:uncharacterized protein n=1 Tax=Suillus paluster TaxID=48578 RepID=UPI001B860D6F|nr:uncharacterized protein EDB91DRAFT_1122464 [Suillus paluster]KAG1745099.1 hypothetical protein EDB91DRAFT_1122464 [Suillus paluster]